MTIKTAKQIFWEYPQLSLYGEQPQYVPLADYEALQAELELLKSGFGISPIEKPLIQFVELKTQNEALQAILKRWVEIGPELSDHQDIDEYPGQTEKLEQLIADTQAALGE